MMLLYRVPAALYLLGVTLQQWCSNQRIIAANLVQTRAAQVKQELLAVDSAAAAHPLMCNQAVVSLSFEAAFRNVLAE